MFNAEKARITSDGEVDITSNKTGEANDNVDRAGEANDNVDRAGEANDNVDRAVGKDKTRNERFGEFALKTVLCLPPWDRAEGVLTAEDFAELNETLEEVDKAISALEILGQQYGCEKVLTPEEIANQVVEDTRKDIGDLEINLAMDGYNKKYSIKKINEGE